MQASALVSVSSHRDVWEYQYEILTGHLLHCSAARELDVSPVFLVPLWGHLLGTGTRDFSRRGALSPRQASPESSSALGIDTLDLLGDRALKLRKLPDHCRCYKSYWYVNAAAYHQARGAPRSLCHFRVDVFGAVCVKTFCRTAVYSHGAWRNAQSPPGRICYFFGK